MKDWAKISEQYPASQEYTYLNTPSCGLISKRTAQQAHQYYQTFLQYGGQKRQDWYAIIQDLKKTLAELLHADTEEIALVPNFTIGMNFMAQMLKSLDKVLLYDQDYPSLCMPWLLHEYKLYYQALEKDGAINLEKTAALIKKENIKIVAISHVQYHSGYCADLHKLGEICKANGSLLLVDATQSLAAVPIDVEAMQIDILLASGYKWMTAGFGNAVMYINKNLLNQFDQPVIGNNSFDGFPHFSRGDDIPFNMRSFEVGHFDYASFLNMASALHELKDIGISEIYQYNQRLSTYLYERLSDKIISNYAVQNRSGIVLLRGDESLYNKLNHHKIATTLRGKGVRVGIHFYNSKNDIDRLAEVLNTP